MQSLADVQRELYKPNKGPPMLLLADDPQRHPKRKRRKVDTRQSHWIPPRAKDMPLSNFPASQLPEGFPPELAFRALAAYSFLRTVSCELRLSPFTPNVFLRALYLPYPNKLIGQIHSSLLRILLATLNMGYSCKPKGSCTPEVVIKKRRVDGVRWPLRAGDNLTFLDNYTWPLFYDDYCHLTADVLWAFLSDDENHADFRNIGMPSMEGMILEEDLIEQEEEESLMAPARMSNHVSLDDNNYFAESLGRGSRGARRGARRTNYALNDSDDESFEEEPADEALDGSDDEEYMAPRRKSRAAKKRGRPRTKKELPKSSASAKNAKKQSASDNHVPTTGSAYGFPQGAVQRQGMPAVRGRPQAAGMLPRPGRAGFAAAIGNNSQRGHTHLKSRLLPMHHTSKAGPSAGIANTQQSPQLVEKNEPTGSSANGSHNEPLKRSPRKLPMHKSGSPPKKKVKIGAAQSEESIAGQANSLPLTANPGASQLMMQQQLQRQQQQQQQAIQNAQIQAMIAQQQVAMLAMHGRGLGNMQNFAATANFNQQQAQIQFQLNNAFRGANMQMPLQSPALGQQSGFRYASPLNNNGKFYPQSMRTPALPHSAPSGPRKHQVSDDVSEALHNFIAGNHFKPKKMGAAAEKDAVNIPMTGSIGQQIMPDGQGDVSAATPNGPPSSSFETPASGQANAKNDDKGTSNQPENLDTVREEPPLDKNAYQPNSVSSEVARSSSEAFSSNGRGSGNHISNIVSNDDHTQSVKPLQSNAEVVNDRATSQMDASLTGESNVISGEKKCTGSEDAISGQDNAQNTSQSNEASVSSLCTDKMQVDVNDTAEEQKQTDILPSAVGNVSECSKQVNIATEVAVTDPNDTPNAQHAPKPPLPATSESTAAVSSAASAGPTSTTSASESTEPVTNPATFAASSSTGTNILPAEAEEKMVEKPTQLKSAQGEGLKDVSLDIATKNVCAEKQQHAPESIEELATIGSSSNQIKESTEAVTVGTNNNETPGQARNVGASSDSGTSAQKDGVVVAASPSSDGMLHLKSGITDDDLPSAPVSSNSTVPVGTKNIPGSNSITVVKNEESQVQVKEPLSSVTQQNSSETTKTVAVMADATLSEQVSNGELKDGGSSAVDDEDSVQTDGSSNSLCFADREEQWPQFRSVKTMRSGVPYHRLPLEEKLTMLEFLIDEILTVDMFAAEFSRRNATTSLTSTPYGSLPSELELENLENEDECAVCKGEGDLLCCDGCLASYHKGCIDMKQNEELPEGRWLCPECELIDPAKLGPLRGGKKSCLDWFTDYDLKTAEDNGKHAEALAALDVQNQSGLESSAENMQLSNGGQNVFNDHGLALPFSGAAPITDQAGIGATLNAEQCQRNVVSAASLSEQTQRVDLSSATRDMAAAPNTDPNKALRPTASVSDTVAPSVNDYPANPVTSQIINDSQSVSRESQQQAGEAQLKQAEGTAASKVLPSFQKQVLQSLAKKDPDYEYLVVHGFVFARRCDRNSDRRIPLSDIASQQAAPPLGAEKLSQLLKSVGPELSLAWPLAQIPFQALESGGPIIKRSTRHPKIDNFFVSRASYDPSFYQSKYRKTPLSKIVFPGAGFQLIQLLNSDYENVCNNSNTRRISDRLCPSFTGEKRLVESLIAETSLFDPYQLIKDYMLKLESFLNRANLLDEFWGTRNKDIKANVWQINVRKCQSIPRLAALLLRLIDATHRRAFSEQWFVIVGHKEAAEGVTEAAESSDPKSFLPLTDDWTPDAESKKRRWERTPLGNVRSVLAKEGRTVEDWVYGDDRAISHEAAPKRRKRKQKFASRASYSPDKISPSPGKVAKGSSDKEGLAASVPTNSLDSTIASVQKLQEVIEKRVISGIANEIEKEEKKPAAEPSEETSAAATALASVASPDDSKESKPVKTPKSSRRGRTRRSSRVTKKQETPEDFLNSVISNSGKSQNELSMETIIEAQKMAKLVEVKEETSAAPFVDTVKWPICGRLLFHPIGTLSAAEMKRLGRNAGGIMAQYISYTGSYEVGEVSHFHVWRKNLQQCVSYEQLLLQIRVLESYIEKATIQSCETFSKRTPTAKASVPRVIKCTQRDLQTGIDHHFVIQRSKNRGCWVSSRSIELSAFILERSERRERHVAAFNAKVRAKQLEEIRAREAARARAEAEARARAEELQRRQEAARLQAANERAAVMEKARQEKAAKEAAKARERAEREASKRAQGENISRIQRQIHQAYYEHKIALSQLFQQAIKSGLRTVPEADFHNLRSVTFAKLDHCSRLLGRTVDKAMIAQQLHKIEQQALMLVNGQKKAPATREYQPSTGTQNSQQWSQQQQQASRPPSQVPPSQRISPQPSTGVQGSQQWSQQQQQALRPPSQVPPSQRMSPQPSTGVQGSQQWPQRQQQQQAFMPASQVPPSQRMSPQASLQPISKSLQTANHPVTQRLNPAAPHQGHSASAKGLAVDSVHYNARMQQQGGSGHTSMFSSPLAGHFQDHNSLAQRGGRGTVDQQSTPAQMVAPVAPYNHHQQQQHVPSRQPQQPDNSPRQLGQNSAQVRSQLLQMLQGNQGNQPTVANQAMRGRQQPGNLDMSAKGAVSTTMQDSQRMVSNNQNSASNDRVGVSPVQQYQNSIALHGVGAGATSANAGYQNAVNSGYAQEQHYRSSGPAPNHPSHLGYSNAFHGGANEAYGQQQGSQGHDVQAQQMVFDIEPTPIEQMGQPQSTLYTQNPQQQQPPLPPQQGYYQQPQQQQQQQQQQYHQWYQSR